MAQKMDKKTVSLFHCNDVSGADAKGFATVQSKSLTTTPGKFSNGNKGPVLYKNNQWDSVFLSGSWTVDFWIYPGTASDWQLDLFLGGNSRAYATLRIQTENIDSLAFFISGGNGWDLSQDGFPCSKNTWHHVAVVYDGTYGYIFIDGFLQKKFSFYLQSIPGSMNYFGCGWDGIGSWNSNSYRDEIRISKGARWTGNFTPPSSPE